jgi:hypothetical protein
MPAHQGEIRSPVRVGIEARFPVRLVVTPLAPEPEAPGMGIAMAAVARPLNGRGVVGAMTTFASDLLVGFAKWEARPVMREGRLVERVGVVAAFALGRADAEAIDRER